MKIAWRALREARPTIRAAPKQMKPSRRTGAAQYAKLKKASCREQTCHLDYCSTLSALYNMETLKTIEMLFARNIYFTMRSKGNFYMKVDLIG